MKKFKAWYFLPILLASFTVSAQAETGTNPPKFLTFKDKTEAFNICRQSAEAINSDVISIREASKILRPYWVVSQELFEAQMYSSEQTFSMGKNFWGNKVDTVFVRTKTTDNDTFLQHQFLLKRTTTALVFNCSLYKPQDKWQLLSFTVTDNPLILLKEEKP